MTLEQIAALGSKLSSFLALFSDCFGRLDATVCLIVARNVLTGELKYFLSNRVPGERNPV